MPSKLKRFEQQKKTQIATNKGSILKFKQLSLMMVTVYLLYLGKSALGINISDRYSVPKLFKAPFMAMDCLLPIEGNYCYKTNKKISFN